MSYLENLKKEMRLENRGQRNIRPYLLYLGYREHYNDEIGLARAYAAASLFRNHKKKVFRSDLIAGSVFGLLAGEYDLPDVLLDKAERIADSYSGRNFVQNVDHYAPDYAAFLSDGVGGVLERIRLSMERYAEDPEKTLFLQST
ncbi:MAG: hypothetical protein PUC47_06705, partial [Oscillospiraceae bacterium]|nr:hypothetical protein [Oscillospiraceae bacterium]